MKIARALFSLERVPLSFPLRGLFFSLERLEYEEREKDRVITNGPTALTGGFAFCQRFWKSWNCSSFTLAGVLANGSGSKPDKAPMERLGDRAHSVSISSGTGQRTWGMRHSPARSAENLGDVGFLERLNLTTYVA